MSDADLSTVGPIGLSQFGNVIWNGRTYFRSDIADEILPNSTKISAEAYRVNDNRPSCSDLVLGR